MSLRRRMAYGGGRCWWFFLGCCVTFSRTLAFVTPQRATRTRSFSVSTRSGCGPPLSFTSSSIAAAADVSVMEEAKLQLLQTLIDNGVKAALLVLVVLFILDRIGRFEERRDKRREQFQREEELSMFTSRAAVEDLYDDLYPPSEGDGPGSGGRGGLRRFFGGGGDGGFDFWKTRSSKRLVNLGIPQRRYIQVERINDRYDSYQFSLQEATTSKAAAAATLRRKNFQSALGKALLDSDETTTTTSWTAAEAASLIQAEREFLYKGRNMVQHLEACQLELSTLALTQTFSQLNVTVGALDPMSGTHNETSNATTTTTTTSRRKQQLLEDIRKTNVDLVELETNFVQSVVQSVGPSRANAMRVALLGKGGESLLKNLEERPLSSLLGGGSTLDANANATASTTTTTPSTKSVFQTTFLGDVTASQVAFLREEVTAILSVAQPGVDEAVLLLQTGGGTVTGYGLAAAQLQRLMSAGIRLTICVEEVAASGGYLMSCVADRIVASPFSVLGSIGVITDIPNVYERLKTEGIEFQTVTAGKYKRTLTPTKKITKEDKDKTQADLEDVLKLFKSYVAKNRPSLDIEAVATGETWVGTDALEKGLCDELATLDDVLIDYVRQGCNVYSVKYDPEPEPGKEWQSLFRGSSGSKNPLRLWIQTLVQSIVQEVVLQLGGEPTMARSTNDDPSRAVTEKYLLMDPQETKDRFRLE